jgi:hypothetical protein
VSLLFLSVVSLLFVRCVCINVRTVIRIYVCCNNLNAHLTTQESMVRGLVAQTVDGNLRVRAPGFRSGASP